jgi:beta-galactosidase/beta-glucuronidase
MLHFGAVDYRADVWVDGQHVVTHEGGHTPFSADITAALRGSTSHAIVVRAEDDPLDMAKPRGKQDWRAESHVIWYHRTTGIWQPVWLEIVASTSVIELRWTPSSSCDALSLTARLARHGSTPVAARIELTWQGRLLVDDTCAVTGDTLQRVFALNPAGLGIDPEQLLWSPDSPTLIDATITLLQEGRPLDVVHSYAGVRSVKVDSGRFWLNGSPFFLRMALEQGYWPESHLASPSDAALQREGALAKSLGFNGVRIHQKIEDPRFLYWCDRLGLCVWEEMPSAFAYSEPAVARLTREWMEALHRDYSHPCIIAWVPFNESWGVPDVRHDCCQRSYVHALYHLTRALDGTRPVIGNDGWEYCAGEMIGVHDYTSLSADLTERYGTREALEHTLQHGQPGHRVLMLEDAPPGAPVVLSEFGGISLAPAPGEAWYGYGTVRSADEFGRKYADLVGAVAGSQALAGFCYTQLTDTVQETNGLVTEKREPKVDAALLRRITTGVLPVEIASARDEVLSQPD